MQKSENSIDRIQYFYDSYQGIPLRLKSIEQELATPLPAEVNPQKNDSLESLELKLEEAKIALDSSHQMRDDIETEAAARSERLTKIFDDTTNTHKRLEELQRISATTISNGDKENLAKQTATQAEQDYLRIYLMELEQEQRSYEMRRDLLRARRQQVERQILIGEQYFNTIEQNVNQLRTTVADKAVQAADTAIRAATSAHPLVRAIVDENQKLATELSQLSTLTASVSEDKKLLTEKLSTLRRQYEGIKEKVNKIGLTDAIGLKLRSDKNQLPDAVSYASSLKMRRDEVNRVQLRRIELEDRLLELIDIKREASQQSSLAKFSSENELRALQNALEYALGEQKNSYLKNVIKAYDIYFEQHLFPIMESEREIIALIEEYEEYIDTRILWIQSAPPIGFHDVTRLGAALSWLFGIHSANQVIQNMSNDFVNNFLAIGVSLFVIGLLVSYYHRLKEKLSNLGRYITKLSKAKFTDTLMAAAITALMVLPWPLLIYLISWRIELSGLDNNYALAIASGLYVISYLLFFGLLLRQICRPNGLGESHFRWKTEKLTLVRHQLAWYLPTILPLAFIVSSTMAQPTQGHHDSLGRLCFITLMLLSSFFIYKLLKPTAGLLKEKIEKHPGSWLDRLKGVWFPFLCLLPAFLAIASAAGYSYTAIQLCLYISGSIGMIFAITVIRELFVRWINITQRKLALEQWRKKHEAQAELNNKNEKADSSDTSSNEEIEINVDAVSTQTMRLLNSAYWLTIVIGTLLIWVEALPALNILNDIVLWNSETSNADGTTIQSSTTLANVLLSIVILMMTFFISRNIPGLLEIAVLQHLPFTPSGRYAISTISRYILIIIGLSMTFSAIGIGWSKVQWLAAAITVGLGFGLQEIFANFVSGLIILFERQIRVGDSVTVGNISGKVSRIQMRATTITDWDRKELIIPNKEFVTGQVINWSLSDTILRITVPVGIAYGSNTKLAYETLLAVANEHQNVLSDPEPNVRFVFFGESSLDFELRVYIPHPDLLLETQHELHMDIDQRFRDADIEIAFPQRDLHIRNIPTDIQAVLANNNNLSQP